MHDVVDITRHYAEIGMGRDSDANRAFSQWKRRRADVLKAEEELAVAAARLANRLNLDPSALQAAGGPLVELDLVDLGTSSASCCRSPCDSDPISRPAPRRSARPKPT